MKKTKIIIPALGMLLLSTAASVTGTVAWFSMNNFVTATGMQVKARAENGIVISNQSAATGTGVTWKETAASARASYSLALKPTSTATAATWVHSTSNDSADNNTGNAYNKLTLTLDTTTGAGYVDDNDHAGFDYLDDTANPKTYVADSMYYSKHSFFIKSSAEAINSKLYIVDLDASGNTNSVNLDKALRVLVRLESDASTAKVFTPFGGDTSYDVATDDLAAGATTGKTSVSATASSTAHENIEFLSGQVIPASNAAPLEISVYLYFEGEDTNCKSDNLTTTLDNLSVTITFGTQTKTNPQP